MIEPATPFADEQAALDLLLAALVGTGAEVAAILLTHHHQDHTGYATALRERTGAPIHAHALTAARLDFPVDVLLADGQEVALDDGFSLAAMHTPGHAPGHLVFCERRTGLFYAGDLVAGTGTILIDPEDDGDMIAYLASLERVAAAQPVALIPAHGPLLADPQDCLRRYRAHRLMREEKILAAIPAVWRAVSAVLAEAYAETPSLLWPLAARSLEAHLRKLDVEGRVGRRGSELIRL